MWGGPGEREGGRGRVSLGGEISLFLVTTILLGDRQQTESPSALLETVKAKHSGNQGLPSEVEDLLKGRR